METINKYAYVDTEAMSEESARDFLQEFREKANYTEPSFYLMLEKMFLLAKHPNCDIFPIPGKSVILYALQDDDLVCKGFGDGYFWLIRPNTAEERTGEN